VQCTNLQKTVAAWFLAFALSIRLLIGLIKLESNEKMRVVMETGLIPLVLFILIVFTYSSTGFDQKDDQNCAPNGEKCNLLGMEQELVSS
jgi:hypothetical protein